MTLRRGFTLDFRATPPAGGNDGSPPNASAAPAGKNDAPALTVTQLTRQIKSLLEGQFPAVTVEGEIGSISSPPSGHLYLTLKDGQSSIDAVLWRSAASRLSFRPTEGDKVVARGEVTVYEPRGRYQMVITALRPAGEGDLRAKLEALVAKLREEGLFDPALKRPLPELPRRVGIVTSSSGAAVRDIIKVARKRWPAIELLVSPCLVQGREAGASIVRALNLAATQGDCDLLIVGRGGGAQEDLSAFNEEALARAVRNCPVPVISAVGHEVDVTICDLVADARAATPSEAAEMCVPDRADWADRAYRLQRALARALTGRIERGKARLELLANSSVLRRPFDLITQRRQLLDETALDLQRGIQTMLERRSQRMALAAARLSGLNPLGALSRGYSLTRRADGTVITDASSLQPGDEVRSTFARGTALSRITAIFPDDNTTPNTPFSAKI